jgi:hypothetical protein
MLSTLIAISFAGMSPSVSTVVDSNGRVPYRQCRYLVQGASAKDDVKVCRTKAEWRQYDMCNSATSYCSKEQKAKRYGRATAFAMSEDSRIVCKLVKGTGSRLSSMKICLPVREWERQWLNASSSAFDMQDHSTRPGGLER